MSSKKSRDELNRGEDNQIVDQSLGVRNALNEAVRKDASVSNAVINAQCPSEAWRVLTSMVEDENNS